MITILHCDNKKPCTTATKEKPALHLAKSNWRNSETGHSHCLNPFQSAASSKRQFSVVLRHAAFVHLCECMDASWPLHKRLGRKISRLRNFHDTLTLKRQNTGLCHWSLTSPRERRLTPHLIAATSAPERLASMSSLISLFADVDARSPILLDAGILPGGAISCSSTLELRGGEMSVSRLDTVESG